MPNIEVDAARKRDVIEAHRSWAKNTYPRQQGQIGEIISTLIEGPTGHRRNEIRPYSDFDSSTSLVSFCGVEQSFLDFLSEKCIPFEEIP
jgi:hypothetical protein